MGITTQPHTRENVSQRRKYNPTQSTHLSRVHVKFNNTGDRQQSSKGLSTGSLHFTSRLQSSLSSPLESLCVAMDGLKPAERTLGVQTSDI